MTIIYRGDREIGIREVEFAGLERLRADLGENVELYPKCRTAKCRTLPQVGT